MANALRFRHTDVAKQSGERARLKVVQGPDFGTIFVVVGEKATIGRGEENDIVISDLKASRRHAELARLGTNWVMRDAGSANGLLHNGKSSRSAELRSSDTVSLGETTFEFVTSEAGTAMLISPPRSMERVLADQAVLSDHKQKIVTSLSGLGASLGGDAGKKRQVVLIAGAALVALLLFWNPEKKPGPPVPAQNAQDDSTQSRNLASFLPSSDVGTKKTANEFFKEGFREYLDGNYLRARAQFQTVLQIDPSHALATLYLENCQNAIEEEVKFYLEHGKKDFDAGKLSEAKEEFESILRLLYKDRSNPAYAEAREQLGKVVSALKGGES